MIYFVIIIGLLIMFGAHQYLTSIRLYYMSECITKLRDAKHEAMLYLIEKGPELPQKDADELRHFIGVTTASVSYMSSPRYVKILSIKQVFNGIILSNEKIKTVPSTENKEIRKFKGMFVEAVFTSLNAVPFFKIRLVVYAVKVVVFFLTKAGLMKLKQYAAFDKFLQAEENITNNHCMG